MSEDLQMSHEQEADRYLQELEKKSVTIIREAKAQFKNLAVMWSTGKDSTTTLWLCKKAFFGKIPFPVIHIDTGYKFPEIYEFRDKIAKEWNFDLIIAKNGNAIENGMSPNKGRFECCTLLKTQALKDLIAKEEFDALLLAIRRDEHGIRGQYVKQEKLPINPLYFAKNGMRYRSLGCKPCTVPVPSNAKTIEEIVEELRTSKTPERAGRSQDKEKAYMMQKLRSLGYM